MVSVASNYKCIEPLAKDKRIKVDEDMPFADLHDNYVSNYRVAIRGKKKNHNYNKILVVPGLANNSSHSPLTKIMASKYK